MAYPNNYDVFTTKKNKYEVISNEAHVIPGSPHIVVTSYAILENVSIPGYTEVIGSPGPGQFKVDYGTSNIYFNSINEGANINVTYKTKGSPIMAEDLNSLQTAVTNIEHTLGLDPQGSYETIRDRLDDVVAARIPEFVDWYTPSGVIDGVNSVFQLDSNPNPSSSLEVTINGLHLVADVEYIIDGLSLIFIGGQVPEVGDIIQVRYRI